MFLLSISWALAADPHNINVTYTARFDLPATADRVCAMTQICDCSATWSGTGVLTSSSGNKLTFRGTWTLQPSTCNDAFLLWTPSDGAAYHTVQLSPDRSAITEWIAHGRAGDTTRFESDIKSRGQVWLAGMSAALDPASHTAAHFERETGAAGPFPITSEHSLTVTLIP